MKNKSDVLVLNEKTKISLNVIISAAQLCAKLNIETH